MVACALALAVLLAPSAPFAVAAPRPIAEVHQARIDAAARAHATALAAYNTGTGPLEPVYHWSVRWLQAERAVARTDAERLQAAGRHRQRMDQLVSLVGARVTTGLASAADAAAAAYYSVEAELWSRGESP
jgi:hypothetical protein